MCVCERERKRERESQEGQGDGGKSRDKGNGLTRPAELLKKLIKEISNNQSRITRRRALHIGKIHLYFI